MLINAVIISPSIIFIFLYSGSIIIINNYLQVDTEWLKSFDAEDFLIGDVTVKDSRHFIFGTESQLEFLRTARTWFVDGTFNVVKFPIQQLWTISVFIRKDDIMEQVPVIAVLMSSRSEIDYQQASRFLLMFQATGHHGM